MEKNLGKVKKNSYRDRCLRWLEDWLPRPLTPPPILSKLSPLIVTRDDIFKQIQIYCASFSDQITSSLCVLIGPVAGAIFDTVFYFILN